MEKHLKIFSSEIVYGMKPVLCIHVPDSLYIICVFYFSRIRNLLAMATLSFDRLETRKVEIGNFFLVQSQIFDIRVLEGADVGVMWSNVVEETGEPGENHRTWTGDHYPATCIDPDSNPDRRGDKRVRYPLRYPGPQRVVLYSLVDF